MGLIVAFHLRKAHSHNPVVHLVPHIVHLVFLPATYLNGLWLMYFCDFFCLYHCLVWSGFAVETGSLFATV